MKTVLAFVAVLVIVISSDTNADTFGNGANSFEIQFVTIGNAGYAADTTGTPNPVGAVPRAYRIAKFEVSADLILKANAESAFAGAPLNITHAAVSPTTKAAYSISWLEAARFVNWLNTSAGNIAAYKFDMSGAFQLWSPSDSGYDPGNKYRNSRARYFLPTDKPPAIVGLSIVWRKSKSDVEPTPAGYARDQNDLNKGARGYYIYLCTKKAVASKNVKPITGIYVLAGKSTDITAPAGYTKINRDLNKGSGGPYIYLCYTTDTNLKPLREMTAVMGDNSSVAAPEGYTKDRVDLNKGVKGKFIYFVYRR